MISEFRRPFGGIVSARTITNSYRIATVAPSPLFFPLRASCSFSRFTRTFQHYFTTVGENDNRAVFENETGNSFRRREEDFRTCGLFADGGNNFFLRYSTYSLSEAKIEEGVTVRNDAVQNK